MEPTFYTDDNNAKVKAWDYNGTLIDDKTLDQALECANMPFIKPYIALMPDAHYGMGSTVGSVIPMKNVVMPSAVGVDIGCGMRAIRLPIRMDNIPQKSHKEIREAIEQRVPSGRTMPLEYDRGSWHNQPQEYDDLFFNQDCVDNELKNSQNLNNIYNRLIDDFPGIAGHKTKHPVKHLGTLGTGNHFLELCADTEGFVWIMVHSGSRGPGAAIGRFFREAAIEECEKWHIDLPNKDLAYLPISHPLGTGYIEAMNWAMLFAKTNRRLMVNAAHDEIYQRFKDKWIMDMEHFEIDCHHNYMSLENHFGENIYIVRKGAIRARAGEYGIIPGSMGACSFIVKGKGNKESFHSCSHGAGRLMSRNQAKNIISLEAHIKATEGVECRKDISVLDESPAAYKPIEHVMVAQSELVEPVYQLKQFICIKGVSEESRIKRNKHE